MGVGNRVPTPEPETRARDQQPRQRQRVQSTHMYNPPAERDTSKPYIAIVDDDSAFASYLRTFLSLRGYEARCYTRGDELLAAMKQTEAPDAVLLDVMMPGLDGMATLRALKA